MTADGTLTAQVGLSFPESLLEADGIRGLAREGRAEDKGQGESVKLPVRTAAVAVRDVRSARARNEADAAVVVSSWER